MKAPLGTISHGTLRTEDLIKAFTDTLESLNTHDAALVATIAEARALDPDSEDASAMVNETLIDALQEYAPPYCYFGTLEGDGSDFGFWSDIDSLEEDARFGEVQKVNDTSAADGSTEFVMHVNDHGNVTLYRTKVELEEVWAVV